MDYDRSMVEIVRVNTAKDGGRESYTLITCYSGPTTTGSYKLTLMLRMR